MHIVPEIEFNILYSWQIWQFRRRFDQCVTSSHCTYTVELHRLWSVPGCCWSRRHCSSEVCLWPSSVQIPHHSVSDYWLCKRRGSGSLR